MKFFLSFLFFLILLFACNNEKKVIPEKNLILLSQEYLEKCKNQVNPDSVKHKLANYDNENLTLELNSNAKKTTFWLNVYNASTQDYLSQNASHLADKEKFFNQKVILVAGEKFSLNEIENQILRGKASTRKGLKSFKVSKLDPRIHFALNCGAKSCPPILFYDLNELNAQLDLATESFLKIECELKNDSIYLPMIFSWFKDDFGGEQGVFNFLKKYQVISADEKPKIIFQKYDWELMLGKYNK